MTDTVSEVSAVDPLLLLEATEVSQIIKYWEERLATPDFDVVPYLTRLAEIIEAETDEYNKLDPDPFDDRHPCRTHPTCALGHSLKVLFKKDTFMSKLVHDYLRESWGSNSGAVNTAAARLFVDILPGLETSVVYQETEGLILRLFGWAEDGPEPLRSYALGLLGASMELPDVASRFKEKNMHLVPLMLSRLRSLQEEFLQIFHRPFAQFSTPVPVEKSSPVTATPSSNKRKKTGTNLELKKRIRVDFEEDGIFPDISEVVSIDAAPLPGNDDPLAPTPVRASQECSSSSWAVMESNIIGTWKVFPITLATRQIFTLRYLSPLGEYQEMLSYAFENNAVQLIINYLDTKKTKDSRLTFEAIKYLSALLCHKKFALEFINCGGLQKMLQVPRPSIAATGVSLSLYYIAYAEDAMEKICLMSKSVLCNLVSYVMWLMECSHNSGRNHAIMFFGVVYPFRIMLDLFDTQDGLRRILNVISTQPNFLTEDLKHTEEEQLITRQAVRQVSFNLKRYFECHLGFLAEKLKRMQQVRGDVGTAVIGIPYYKPLKLDEDRLKELNDIALELLPLWGRWHPVEKFLKMGGLQIVMQVIALAYDWNYSGRSETVKSVLEVLGICCLFPRVQLQLTERFTLVGSNNLAYGLNIILSAAEGEVINDPEVRRAALVVIGNCVCGSLNRPGNDLSQQTFLTPRTPAKHHSKSFRTAEELLSKMWECVRVNNGILILTRLLHVKTPITDADSLRALACWCLAGLARYKPICQVLEQLPLMRNGVLQMLMREPILQEKRHDHVMFQKHALEIIKLVYGKMLGLEYDLSVVAIHKSDLISQTRIQYNEKQLLQLIHEHLITKGLNSTANTLMTEGKLDIASSSSTSSSTSSSSSSSSTSSGPGNSHNDNVFLTPSTPTTTTTSTTTGRRYVGGKIYMSMKSNHPQSIQQQQQQSSPKVVTLDTIVKEYLTNQHSLCKTPMAACPTFDLVVPHKCPAPKSRPSTVSFTSRFGRLGWMSGISTDRKLIYSKFKPFRVLRSETDDNFTSCAFSPCYQWIIVGTSQGDVKLFNNVSGSLDGTYSCHEAEIYHVQPNSKGNLLLTSNLWRRPMSGLWRTESIFEKVIEFEKEEYVEFSQTSQDKIIGTNMDHAFVYDIETTKKILSFEPRMSNQYIKNRATFDPTDHLILSDGILWDVNNKKEIHKFDKLNENINGIFHPNGLEIICNSEVWDVRTFKLLKTVRATDQSLLTFTNDGNIIYGIKSARETTDGFRSGDTSFVTLDAGDYSSIGTIELKRSILSLATSPNDLQIALVENHGATDTMSDSCIRYYEVGRSRYGEDETVDEEEDDLQSRDSDGDEEHDDDEEEDEEDQDDLDRILDELLPENDDMIEADSSQDDDTEGEQIGVEVETSDNDDDDDDEGSLSLASTSSDDSD